MKILFLTVGGSPEPLLTAMQAVRPDHTFFFCSEDQGRTKGSYTQVEGENGLAANAGLAPGKYELIRIREFDDLQCCYKEMVERICQTRTRYPEAQFIADYTGGTKSMTAALAMAALDEGCELRLVTGTRTDLTKVLPGTQFARAVAVGDLRARRALQSVVELLNRFDYAGAQRALNQIATIPVSNDILRRIQKAIALCRAFDAWDRFDHSTAQNLLAPYRTEFVDHYLVLEELVAQTPRDPYLRIEDLLLNAQRRAAQERFDDAIARIYRALEWLAQTRLSSEHKIETGNINIQMVPESLREGYARKTASDGRIQIGLQESWTLLAALKDDLLRQWFDSNRSTLKNFLSVRNGSILAHGSRPISRDIYDREGSTGLRLCQDVLQLLASGRGQRRAKQLPQSLPGLNE
jgi:hypothetical protein